MDSQERFEDHGSQDRQPPSPGKEQDFESEERRKRNQYPDEGGDNLDFLYDGDGGVDFHRADLQPGKDYRAYMSQKYSYITEAEENLKDKFKQLMDVEENNVFFELEMKDNIDEIYKYIHYDEFDAREKAQIIQKILGNCTDILGSNDTNLDVDKKTVDQVTLAFFVIIHTIFKYFLYFWMK